MQPGSGDHEDSHRRRNAARFVTLGSRSLMEQVTAARAKVELYFGKVRQGSIHCVKCLCVCQGLGQLAAEAGGQSAAGVVPSPGSGAAPHPPVSHAPYLETHTRAEVEWLLRPGTRVTLNARKIRGCYLPLQVSIVYTLLLISMC